MTEFFNVFSHHRICTLPTNYEQCITNEQVHMKGAKTLKPPVIFRITQKAALLNDTPTEAGIDGACHLVKLFQLHPMTHQEAVVLTGPVLR